MARKTTDYYFTLELNESQNFWNGRYKGKSLVDATKAKNACTRQSKIIRTRVKKTIFDL